MSFIVVVTWSHHKYHYTRWRSLKDFIYLYDSLLNRFALGAKNRWLKSSKVDHLFMLFRALVQRGNASGQSNSHAKKAVRKAQLVSEIPIKQGVLGSNPREAAKTFVILVY